jgi:hypothetical protein
MDIKTTKEAQQLLETVATQLDRAGRAALSRLVHARPTCASCGCSSRLVG